GDFGGKFCFWPGLSTVVWPRYIDLKNGLHPDGCVDPCRLHPAFPLVTHGENWMSMYIGEALAGDGNEVAHIDLLIGSKDGPVGHAFASALVSQSAGHSNLLAVLEPNLAVKPSTVTVTKVTIKNSKQAVQMFGPAQAAVAKAVADAVEEGTIPKD